MNPKIINLLVKNPERIDLIVKAAEAEGEKDYNFWLRKFITKTLGGKK